MAYTFLEGCICDIENQQNSSDSGTDNGSDIDVDLNITEDEAVNRSKGNSNDESNAEVELLPQNSNDDWSDKLSKLRLEDFS